MATVSSVCVDVNKDFGKFFGTPVYSKRGSLKAVVGTVITINNTLTNYVEHLR